MNLDQIPILRRLIVRYTPWPDRVDFQSRLLTQSVKGIEVGVAVLDARESQRYFGVPMARRGIQPLWLHIKNGGDKPFRLHLVAIDPNYYSPLEAAAVNHYSSAKRLVGFGALAWFFLPLVILLPLKLITAWLANQQMDDFFQARAFRLRPIHPGEESSGFVFTSLDAGNKIVHVRLLGVDETLELVFTVPVPGLDTDYLRHEHGERFAAGDLVACDLAALRQRLAESPRATSNQNGTREGDPVNLAVAGEYATILSAFGARWDETEIITLETCWKTLRAFLTGREYRYSPVSALYLFGRSQDFALQRIRRSINERLHLRLWETPWRFQGLPVWVGQVSRDIGVRFTWKTWNLTTHRIDSDVDEARDYVLEDLLEAERLEMAGYLDGRGVHHDGGPWHNLTGDPYFTDGKIAAMVISPARTTPKFIGWS